MKNGIYKAAFKGTAFSYTGVIVLNEGIAKGGDDSFYYVGVYENLDGKITAKLRVRKHSTGDSVTGIDDYSIELEGEASGSGVKLKSSPDFPALAVTLTFLEEY